MVLVSPGGRRAAARASVALFVLALGACAPRPGANAPALRDPYEKFNRGVYGFNKGLDRIALKPATKVYRGIIPRFARSGITNFFNNLDEPLSFINALAQGKINSAWHTLKRFTVNTTIGLAGLTDPATKWGIEERPEDFGQTLAVWGVKSGPFLMLPVVGPSTFRDLTGFAVDLATNPVTYARNEVLHPSTVAKIGQFALETLDLRSKLIDAGADEVLESSLDEYATVRSAFLQRRESDIYDGSPPDIDDEPFEDAPLAPGATPPVQSDPTVPSPAVPPPTAEPGTPIAEAVPALGTTPAEVAEVAAAVDE